MRSVYQAHARLTVCTIHTSGQIERAFDVFSEMEQAGFVPNGALSSTLAHAE